MLELLSPTRSLPRGDETNISHKEGKERLCVTQEVAGGRGYASPVDPQRC